MLQKPSHAFRIAVAGLMLVSCLAAAPAPFSLRYEIRGSEYPVVITITLSGNGAYLKTLQCPPYGDSGSRWERVTGTLAPADLAAFIEELVVRRGFFSLPGSFTNEGPVKMDMATQALEVSHGSRLHRIGGYNAGSFPGYKGVFQLVEELEKKLQDKKKAALPF